MSMEAEIARSLYEEVRDSAQANMSVRLGVRLEEYKRRWPGASRDQILRGCLIAYEMLIQDVSEAVATASGRERTAVPAIGNNIDDEGSYPLGA